MKKLIIISALHLIGTIISAQSLKIESLLISGSSPSAHYPELYYEIQIARLNQKTSLELFYDETVQEYIDAFLNGRKDEYLLFRERSEFFFPLLDKYLSQYNLPNELKYVAVLESGLRFDARSPSDAVGLWQFKEKTGSHYGLVINDFRDDRLDPEASTIAACKYLQVLYGIFGSWELALLAYNAGPTYLKERIIKNQNISNYHSLVSHLSLPARRYLPALVAIIYLFENYDIHFQH